MCEVMPEKMVFVVETDREALQGMIVYFIFHTPKKNDFTVGPKVTCSAGEITLTKESVEEVLEKNHRDFPMDYSGVLCDCNLLSVVLEPKSELEQRIFRLREFYPDNAACLEGLFKNCTNRTKGFRRDIKLPVTEKVIRIVIT